MLLANKYTAEIKAVIREGDAVVASGQRLSWMRERLEPESIRQAGRERLAQAREDSIAKHLLQGDAETRVLFEFTNEARKARDLSFRVQRFDFEPRVRPLELRYASLVRRLREDVNASRPDAYDGWTGADMCALEMLRDSRMEKIAKMTSAEMLTAYQSAQLGESGVDVLMMTLIEQRLDRQQNTAANTDDIAAASELRRVVEDERQQRVPADLEGVPLIIANAKHLAKRLDPRLPPINPTNGTEPGAREAHAAECAAYEAEQQAQQQ